jgi:hypothetical protein
MWLAMIWKLRTRDRLWFIPTNTFIFCRQDEESHSHLLFSCSWTSLLCSKIKSWLRINSRMTTLNSVVRGLALWSKNLEARMRRFSLGLTVYLIWEERNKRIFDSTYNLVDVIICKFQVLFYMVLHFHEKNHFLINVG